VYYEEISKVIVDCHNKETLEISSARCFRMLNECSFHQVTVKKETEIFIPRGPIQKYCLFLPFMRQFDNQTFDDNMSSYYVVTDDWLEFNESFSPTLPISTGCYYDIDLV
jgi:hypothetical protein